MESKVTELLFSKTYSQARQRFRDAANALGAEVHSYSIGLQDMSPDDLTMETATLGPADAPAVVVSSGVHGVEGFFGSAIQLGLLRRLAASKEPPKVRYVLIHGVNPYGFARIRRCNEDNVDLNRNFLTSESAYSGAPDGYSELNNFLNPASPPTRFEPFRLKASWNIWRTGLAAIKDAVAGGQYEYPRGLFYGGKGPSTSTIIVQMACDSWMALSPRIVHIDFHSGLGPFANYKLLLAEPAESASIPWYASAFGAEHIEPLAKPNGTAYTISGLFGGWMQQHFRSREYRFVAAEFGTYDVIRVLSAIRAENRAHHYGDPSTPAYQASKQELLECFCPASRKWRESVVESGLRIMQQSVAAIL